MCSPVSCYTKPNDQCIDLTQVLCGNSGYPCAGDGDVIIKKKIPRSLVTSQVCSNAP